MSTGARILILLILTGLLLAGCGDKAVIDRAKAERIRQETEDKSAARQAEELRKQEDWEVTRKAVNSVKQVFFLLVVCTLSVALSFVLAVAVYRWWQASRAIVTYAETRAALAAGMLKVDQQTLTWPVLVVGDAVHNLETGEVFRLSEPKPADPQQVTGDALIRALAVGTRGVAQLGKTTKDAQAADAIPALAGAVPLVLRPLQPGKSRRPRVQQAVRDEQESRTLCQGERQAVRAPKRNPGRS